MQADGNWFNSIEIMNWVWKLFKSFFKKNLKCIGRHVVRTLNAQSRIGFKNTVIWESACV